MRYFLFLIISLFLFNCSPDDKDPMNEKCWIYQVMISEDCDCKDTICGARVYNIPLSEYTRLKNILDSSAEDCNWVTVDPTMENPESGYLIKVYRYSCDIDLF